MEVFLKDHCSGVEGSTVFFYNKHKKRNSLYLTQAFFSQANRMDVKKDK